jgi:4-oxalocrotonate tautomerase
MPLVRIDLAVGKTVEHRHAIGQVIYDAMLKTLNVPKDDRFQIIAEHPAEGLIFDPNYMGIRRSKDWVCIQITLNEGRTLDQKRAFYKAVADGLLILLDMRPEDVLVNLVEVRQENWSFGNGEAQYS